MKAALLAVFLLCGIILVRCTPVGDLLTPDRLGRLLDASGRWAPVVFIVVYAGGLCMFVPASLLATLGVMLFSGYPGYLYIWMGSMVGCTLAFLVGRYLGRDFAASLIGGRLKRYDDAIERNGFLTVLYLRLAYFPCTPLNFGMGLTRVRFRDYFFGTALGLVVVLFFFVYFVGSVRDAWMSGRWDHLFTWEVLLSLMLLVLSIAAPWLLVKMGVWKVERGA